MADQVVLLRNGQIEQIGTPGELYERPKTDFSAQFLGTPPMNILPVRSIKPDSDQAETVGFIGVRPEKIRLCESGMKSLVSSVDYMGAETVLRLEYNNEPISARIDGQAEVRPGDTVHIEWAEKDEHYFNDNGARLER